MHAELVAVERRQREGLEGVGEGVGGGVVGVVDRGPPELDVRVQEAARAAANRLLDFSKLEGRERRRDRLFWMIPFQKLYKRVIGICCNLSGG